LAAVTVDLWHTLVYLPPEAEETYMARQVSIGVNVLRRAPHRGSTARRSNGQLRSAFERAYTEAVAASVRGRTVTPRAQIERAARATGLEVDPEDYLQGLRREIRSTPFRRAPGALRLLNALRGAGYRVGVISNTVGEPGAYLRPMLTKLGFDPYVEEYVFSDELPWTKPSPRIFRYALERLDEKPGDSVHVGDGWSDIEGARRAGYRGSILYTGLHEYGARYLQLFFSDAPKIPHPSFRVRRLTDVEPLVRRMLPAA
jgi:FMN phosphatase YigB (HAD superfamily)